MPHYGSPDKLPERASRRSPRRRARDPVHHGDPDRDRRDPGASGLEALEAIRGLHERYGHIQEVIVQNFRAKPGTKMAARAEPSLDDLLWTARAAASARAEMHIQVPPNLSYDDFPRLSRPGSTTGAASRPSRSTT
jgi:FO synthase